MLLLVAQISTEQMSNGCGGSSVTAKEKRRSKANEPPTAAALTTQTSTIATSEAEPRDQASDSWFARKKYDLAISLCFVLVGLVFYLVRIEEPRQYIYDEVYHAYTAAQYAAGNTDAWLWTTKAPIPNVAYEWTHPPLGKLLITVSILLWGDTPLGWRFASAIFGALGLAGVYWLGLTLTGKRAVAIIATILTMADGLYFVESRTGVIDIFGTVFMVFAFIACYRFLVAPATAVAKPLCWLGLCMGLAIATKWNAVYPAVLLGMLASWRTYQLLPYLARRAMMLILAVLLPIAIVFVPSLRFGSGLKIVIGASALIIWQLVTIFFIAEGTRKKASAGLRQHLIWVPVGLILLPLVVYLMSFIPFFMAGNGLAEFKELHWQMYWYHSNLKATHAYQSTWYQWPIAYRPVWYSVVREAGMVANTYANGNPLLYWAFLPAVGYVTARWGITKHPAFPVLLIGFFGQWLPWALIPRIAYIYHFLPAAIFGILAVAVALNDLWEWREEKVIGRGLAISYITVVVVAFIFFYPIYSSVFLTPQEFEARIWFENWR